MDKPAEILLFDFLAEKQAEASPDDVIYDLDIHDTIHQAITDKKPKGVRISDATGEMAPTATGGIREYNVELVIVCYAKVEGVNKKERQASLIAVFEIQSEIYRLLLADPSLGGRSCDAQITGGSRGYDVFDGNPFAVANIAVTINAGSG